MTMMVMCDPLRPVELRRHPLPQRSGPSGRCPGTGLSMHFLRVRRPFSRNRFAALQISEITVKYSVARLMKRVRITHKTQTLFV